MNRWMTTVAAFALLTGITAANAQNAPAANTDQSNKAMHQQPSTSGVSQKHAMRTHKLRRHASTRPRYTTGSGRIGAPQNDPSIHQSKQRDSRGTPKGTGPDQFK